MGDYLAELGDEETGNVVLAVPLISWVEKRLGTLRSLHVVNGLGLAAFLPLLVKNLWCQLATCVLYVVYRAFLYSLLTVFVAQGFGEMSVGRIFGAVCLLTSVVQPVQYPLVEVVAAQCGGSLWIVNLILTLSIILPVLALCTFEWFEQGSAEHAVVLDDEVVVEVQTHGLSQELPERERAGECKLVKEEEEDCLLYTSPSPRDS
eukprot:TRINITY_DN9720_c0_g1_i2.p1 TRINITY_DN9720_c0_g1~~TRINITY_DN9720_c0_g1_i2.p1  ORF type:complete len:205 (-),score=50.13 TRINITY_DN9720_c0_g1_i2:99-713(-)